MNRAVPINLYIVKLHGWLNRRQDDIWALILDIGKRWYLYGPVIAIWALAYIRLLIDPTPHVPLLFNWTPSLPYTVAWMDRGQAKYTRGNYVIFSFSGEAQTHYPGLKKQPFFKIIRGVPGDVITLNDRNVLINGQPVGFAKPFAFDRRPLQPIQAGVIPDGYFYMQGTDANSFDSRYRSAGLVRAEYIIGAVTPIW